MGPGDYSLVKLMTEQFTRFPVVFTGPPAGSPVSLAHSWLEIVT